ncbi:MAG: TIGR03503 family protein [Colwellia sp.]|nr:TIGR03503 family protein [Colwellia sp.]MCW9082730.1 TIGR03503 family protein [Colwellia sp.]
MDKTKLVALMVVFYLYLFSQSSAFAQDTEKESFKRTEVKYQTDNITNQIPYFDNRFRIDAELDEITLLFYRVRGSKPIILVRPDGSKLRVNKFDRDKVEWHDDSTFDMIKIKKPMPGPWQAIGDILPESRILIVSDVKIAVDPLPEIVLEGETLKVTGQLFNEEDSIDTPNFRNVVKLDVHFYSTNNSIYENFGANAIKVTSFHDDGEMLDEYAGDSIFTGEFELNFAPGEWQPVYLVKLPMSTRELRQKPIILHKTPITISVVASESEDTPHSMTLTIDPTYVMPDSLVFQGKVTFPDRQVEPFSIMDDQKGETRIKDIRYTEGGVHRISLSAFGKTVSGREFRLVVPEFSFNVKASENQFASIVDESGVEQDTAMDITENILADKEAELALARAAQEQAEEEKSMQTILLIAAGNTVVIVLALIAFLFVRKRKG